MVYAITRPLTKRNVSEARMLSTGLDGDSAHSRLPENSKIVNKELNM